MISAWKNNKSFSWVIYVHCYVSLNFISLDIKQIYKPILEKAKYEQIPKNELQRLDDYVELPERGLQVRCNISDYALAEIWWKVSIFFAYNVACFHLLF